MVKKEVLVRIQTLAIGCKKTKNGFTLLELLVVLMIIGISTTLIVINSDLSSTFIKKIRPTKEHLIILVKKAY